MEIKNKKPQKKNLFGCTLACSFIFFFFFKVSFCFLELINQSCGRGKKKFVLSGICFCGCCFSLLFVRDGRRIAHDQHHHCFIRSYNKEAKKGWGGGEEGMVCWPLFFSIGVAREILLVFFCFFV